MLEELLNTLEGPSPDPLGIASLNATLIAVFASLLIFLISQFFQKRSELRFDYDEALAEIEQVPAPIPNLVIIEEDVRKAMERGWDAVEMDLSELRRLVVEHAGDHMALELFGRKIWVSVAAAAILPPMPRRVFRIGETNRLLWILAGDESPPFDLSRLALVGARIHVVRTFARYWYNAWRGNPSNTEPNKGILLWLNYLEQIAVAANKGVLAKARLGRFERRSERNLAAPALTVLGIAFLRGVLVPVVLPTSPLFVSGVLPLGLVMGGFLVIGLQMGGD